MRKAGLVCVCIMICVLFSMKSASAAIEETAATLLVTTEQLLLSQASLSMLSLGLISANMEHNYTTVDEDRENLSIITDVLDLSMETIDYLLKDTGIDENDIEFIRLLQRTNVSLKKSSKDLMDFCDDSKNVHLNDFADDFKDVADNYDKAVKLLGE